jgi:hypothetical protein
LGAGIHDPRAIKPHAPKAFRRELGLGHDLEYPGPLLDQLHHLVGEAVDPSSGVGSCHRYMCDQASSHVGKLDARRSARIGKPRFLKA